MNDKQLCDLSPRGLLRFLAEHHIVPATSRGLAIIAAWLWDKTEPALRIQLEDFYCHRAGLTLSTKTVGYFMEPTETNDPLLDALELCPDWLLDLVRPYPSLIAKLESK